MSDGLLAVTSLSRAVSGGARVADVGALMWMVVRQVLPCEAMAVFLPDERADQVTVRYAAGAARARRCAIGQPRERDGHRGLGGGEPAAGDQRGSRAGSRHRGRGARTGPPVVPGDAARRRDDAVVAVLALYRGQRDGFSEDDARLVELLAPRLASSLAEAVVARSGECDQPPSLKLVRTSVSG